MADPLQAKQLATIETTKQHHEIFRNDDIMNYNNNKVCMRVLPLKDSWSNTNDEPSAAS